ncbi:MAG: GNAT family N-acetyltransferase [Candidatus Kariarchaeaceae archaeon]|jgi:acetyltransferase
MSQLSIIFEVNGLKLRFRQIEPEDARAWYQFILSCSKHSIYTRYQHAVQFDRQEISKHCDIDPTEEIAYVAELQDGTIVGEVRLYIFENSSAEAEFAILVADAYQGKGIGQVMTREIIRIGKSQGIRRVIAFTDNDNRKMLQVFKKMGFDRTSTVLSQTVDLEKLIE